MKTIKTKIANTEVLIEVTDNTTENTNIDPLGNTRRTSGSLGDDVKKVTGRIVENTLESAADLIFAFADVCKQKSEKHGNSPNEMEMEYSLSLDLKTNLWVFTGGSNSTLKVRMKWKKC